jgi:hypothetical protein
MLLLTPDSLVDERLANSLRARLLIGWLTATLASIVGLYASYKMDLPTGAAIICALGAALLLTVGLARFQRRRQKARRRFRHFQWKSAESYFFSNTNSPSRAATLIRSPGLNSPTSSFVASGSSSRS